MSQAGLVDELQSGLAPLLLGGGLAAEVYSSNMVDDLDRQVAELTERGVAIRAIETQPGRYRKAEATGTKDIRSPSARRSAQATTDTEEP